MRSSCFLTSLLIVLTGSAAADVAPPSELAPKVEEYMAARVARDKFSGTILIARDGVPLVRRAFGRANLELDVPCKPESVYRLGSITKQFTATAVLILAERGKLKLSDPIGKYVPKAPKTWNDITIEHLLTHTSGIVDYTSLPTFPKLMTTKLSLPELIATFKDSPLEFPPGEKFKYSNSGYIVLGSVIEAASGKPYEVFLKEAVFDPLQMRDSGYDHPIIILKNRAAGYSRFLGLVAANADYIDMSLPHAAGALYSTVDDLLKWDRAIAAAKLVSTKSLEAMFTPRKGDYGYGWTIQQKFDRIRQSHGGRIPGFIAMIQRFPSEKLLIVVLSNQDFTPVERIADDLAAAAFGRPYVVPRIPSGSPIERELLERYAGEYEVDRPQGRKETYTVRAVHPTIAFGPKGGKPEMTAVAESNTRFYVLLRDVVIEFQRGADGAVAGFTLIQDNQAITARRAASKPAADSAVQSKEAKPAAH